MPVRSLSLLLALAGTALAQDGPQLYALYCSACHGADGTGATGGIFPPLASSPWLAGEPDRAIKIVLHGLHGPLQVAGKTYDLEMPPQGAMLPDDQIAAILTHVRSNWRNTGAPVTPEMVKAIRAENADRTKPWTAPEILKLHPLPLEKTALTGLTSRVYKGTWKHLPDFSKLKAESVEEEHDGIISLTDSPYENDFGMVWEGSLEIPENGEYIFSLDADDAARILLDGENVLEVHGLGPMNGSRSQRCKLQLSQGSHSVRVEYLEYKGFEGIAIGWKKSGPGDFNWLTDSRDKNPGQQEPIVIAPASDRPVIYRNFISGTSPRAIGVGFPGGLNLAYSADHLAPALVWRGDFIDGRHKWLNRGTAENPPAGVDLVLLANSRALPAAARFKGYQLDKTGNPTFHVKIGSQILSEKWSASSGALQRQLALTGAGGSLEIPLSATPAERLTIEKDGQPVASVTLTPGQPATLTYRWK